MEVPKMIRIGIHHSVAPTFGLTLINFDVLKATMEKYLQEALRVSRGIARIMALSLELDADYFDKPELLGNPKLH
ncbi:putative isopenicillin N synthase [Arabidopsis thaliana]